MERKSSRNEAVLEANAESLREEVTGSHPFNQAGCIRNLGSCVFHEYFGALMPLLVLGFGRRAI